ncbi:MAG: hypothetical protein JJE10_00335 [Thermoleophilia bacterium]|nr:hypothetical protein [Thermoleophilia bacterium]
MDTFLNSNWFRGLVLALAVSVSGFALAACGGDEHEKKTGIVEGERFELGPLEYNVLFTRPLNLNDVEDSEYLVGQPAPDPDQTYIGVFLQAENLDEDEAHALPDSFKLADTAGHTYENLDSTSSYALKPGAEVGPEDVVPALDSTPQVGPIEASMVLFVIDDESLELRPVEFEVEGEDGPASVEVDL